MYHPQGNGQVERFNRTVEAMLAKVVQANQRDWDAHSPEVLFAHRTAIHKSTHFTPYHLKLGCFPMLPVDVMLGQHPTALVEEGEVVKLPQFVEETHQYFNEAYATARSNLKQAHQPHKLAVDKKEHGDTFSVGDQVWLYTRQLKKVAVGNWLPNGVVPRLPTLLWRRQALSSTASSILELHTKPWCIAII